MSPINPNHTSVLIYDFMVEDFYFIDLTVDKMSSHLNIKYVRYNISGIYYSFIFRNILLRIEKL